MISRFRKARTWRVKCRRQPRQSINELVGGPRGTADFLQGHLAESAYLILTTYRGQQNRGRKVPYGEALLLGNILIDGNQHFKAGRLRSPKDVHSSAPPCQHTELSDSHGRAKEPH